MNILFLDDSPSRHDFVCKKKHVFPIADRCKHEGYEIFHAYKTVDIIDYFEKNTTRYFDFVYLDHDLAIPKDASGLIISNCACEVGTTIAKYMADNYDKLAARIGKIIIHSWNAAGAKNMEAILRDAGYTDILISPFSCA